MGLSLGLIFALAGVTGAALVFYVEIDALLHPEIRVEGRADPVSYDRALATLRAEYPDHRGPWRFEITDRLGAIPARYYDPPERAGRAFAPMLVWLSPDGAQVLRRDWWGDTVMTWIYDLHYRLRLERPGGTAMGIAGIAMTLMLLSGLWAWWPRGRIAKALRAKADAGRVRRLHDLHKLAGLSTLPLLLPLAVTGAMLSLPVLQPAVPVIRPLSSATSGVDIGPAAALGIARARYPEARVAWILMPGAPDAPYQLRLKFPGDPSRRFPHGHLWIDRYSGAPLTSWRPGQGGAGGIVNAWLHPIHDGSFGGLVTRLLAFASGLAPLFLFLTGWLRYRARKRSTASASAAHSRSRSASSMQ